METWPQMTNSNGDKLFLNFCFVWVKSPFWLIGIDELFNFYYWKISHHHFWSYHITTICLFGTMSILSVERNHIADKVMLELT